MPLQHPTCTGLRVRTTADAHVIFHAVTLGILPIITRRLDTDERRAITSGCVFVWEERGTGNAEPMGLGIERWTDSIRWGPSRVREEFLFYHEKDPDPIEIDLGYDSETGSPLGYGPAHMLLERQNLVKQTYSVFVETAQGRRKWHLTAYFTQDSLDYLRTIEDIPCLSRLRVPPGLYKSARAGPGRIRNRLADQPLTPYPRPPLSQPPDDTPIHVNGVFQKVLAPLEYLENVPPPRRHPLDEKALMSFFPGLD
ncbi:unnamed protein product [Mycena citricolor]|uniref:Uncharacterized protein n=1 Tax=Mycena citricolor TaxID=2018698 RepID=A0AAD2GZP1_9AGAR|nr:unnamed protein product [Mycena citricolor]CAK5281251.1 unnamed protein product [Mycena citricolor]